ncbi:hypothetical protein E0H36_05305 [Rhizobium leguminosarum bv. viciae]|uniref:hypothetical protein n=1 Tax=Rhizobium leguminosarum TaxID=384 RepID=UPI00103FE8A2|nr:hypothetical protein [Rhizobium leguminosarum]TBZ36441.1 hypothetical protein E0H36_05305 [Rhizobium leguminosarum bv. viciae]
MRAHIAMLFSIFAPVAFAVPAFAQTTAAAAQSEDFSNTLLGKVAIAVISAVLSLVTGYVLLYLKDRREPKKRLSYNAEFRKGMLGFEERIAQDLSVTYKGMPAEHVSYVRCDVLNSGTSYVRDQSLRFEFPSTTEILDVSVDPTPPKEVKLTKTNGGNDGPHESSYSFQQLETGQKLTFHFVIQGKDSDQRLSLFGFNEDADVAVVKGDVQKVADDRNIIERLIFIGLVTLFVPPIINFGPEPLGSMAVAIFYVVALVVAFPTFPTAARVAARFLTAPRSRDAISIGSVATRSGSVIISNSDGVETRTQSSEVSQDEA